MMFHFKNTVRKLRGDITFSGVEQYGYLLEKINCLDYTSMTEEQLKGKSTDLRMQAMAGTCPEDLLVEAYALAREAAWRVLGLRPYDVQVIGAIALHYGNIVEMQTGEGKTLAAVLPAYLNALTGKGVHVLTFNDYLARRDAAWMGPVYRFLGLSVGAVQETMKPEERRKAYACDITYLTAREAGFDFLRSFLAADKGALVHRPYHYAIIDEADSILIDEARIPLVIAGDIPETEAFSRLMARTVKALRYGTHYRIDEYARNVFLTDEGLMHVEKLLGCGNLYASQNYEMLTALHCALHAETLLKRDADYIVRQGKIELVDEFTGRVAEKRHWPDGLQAALEAKEGIEVLTKGQILYSITMQNFIRLYPRFSGMTGTAATAAQEFSELYQRKVVVVPTHRPCIRIDRPDLIFSHKQSKQKSLVSEIVRIHAAGRPILIGTGSVEESEQLAGELHRHGVSCRVLNAKNDELEAGIIANAGLPGAVTVSTNMAGRGIDIKLGGEDERERGRAVSLGGLYVIGANRHESRRVDNQLSGRCGRQGDPGETRFFVSLEDELMVRYRVTELIPARCLPGRQEGPVDHPMVRRELARVQRIIEGQNFEIRKTLIKYFHLLEAQRRMIHEKRLAVLMEGIPLSLLSDRAPERFAQLLDLAGEEVLQRVGNQIALYHINRCWSEYLDYTAYIREGIHLVNMAGKTPLDEFNKMVIEAFEKLQGRIEDEIIATFLHAEITEKGIDIEKEGLKGPSSTWTYMVNDSPEQLGIAPILRNPIAAAVNWPLVLGVGIFSRFFKKRPEQGLAKQIDKD